MTVIGFIRHGVTAWNKEGRMQGSIDIPLDEEGIQMAIKLGNRLKTMSWTTIFSSPLQRAERTAKLIAQQNRLENIMIDNRLKEIGEGQRAGTTEEERVQKWGIGWRNCSLGVESDEGVVIRGLSFIEEITRNYPNEHVLVVSHGSFIKKIIEQLCPGDSFQDELKNGSLTIVHVEEESDCLLYNCVKHLNEP